MHAVPDPVLGGSARAGFVEDTLEPDDGRAVLRREPGDDLPPQSIRGNRRDFLEYFGSRPAFHASELFFLAPTGRPKGSQSTTLRAGFAALASARSRP